MRHHRKRRYILHFWSFVLLSLGALLWVLVAAMHHKIQRARVVAGRSDRLEFLKRIAQNEPLDLSHHPVPKEVGK
jgi:hypothetical protein